MCQVMQDCFHRPSGKCTMLRVSMSACNPSWETLMVGQCTTPIRKCHSQPSIHVCLSQKDTSQPCISAMLAKQKSMHATFSNRVACHANACFDPLPREDSFLPCCDPAFASSPKFQDKASALHAIKTIQAVEDLRSNASETE